MALKNQVPNVYSVGLQNAGSYQVSGTPYLAHKSVNAGEEVKIEFPSVTKNVVIRIPYAPNSGRFLDSLGESTWFAASDSPTAVGSLDPYGGGTGYAFSYWVKTTEPTGNSKNTLMYGGNGAGGYTGMADILYNGTNGMSLGFDPPGNGDLLTNALGTNLKDGNWHHILVTEYDSKTYLYVNNVGVSTSTLITGSMTSVRFGWNGGGGNRQLHYDEATFFKTGFSPAEVSELYNSGEWFDPREHSQKSNIEAWWTWGDDRRDAPVPLTTTLQSAIFDVIHDDDDDLNLQALGAGKQVEIAVGPFTSQTTGKLRTSMVRSLIGGINFPSVAGLAGLTDNYLSVPQYGGAGYNIGAGGNDQTVSFWYKVPPNGTPTYSTYFMRASNATGINIKITQRDGDIGDGTEGWIEADLAGAGAQTPAAPLEDIIVVMNNEWRHVILVMEGSKSKLRMYLDGEQVASGESTMTTSATVNNWWFPTNGGVVQNYGAISIWNAGFDDAQALELYNIGGAASPTSHSLSSDLKNYYNFDPSDGDTTTTIKDRVGSNDATIVVRSGLSRTAKFTEGPGRNVVAGKHYYEMQGYGTSIELPMKTKELYLTGVDAQTTFEVIAELTNIPDERMYALTGSGIDE